MYQIIYSTQARKDAEKISRSGLKNNVLKLIEILHNNPYQNPPPYEKLLECGHIMNKHYLGLVHLRRTDAT
jgi:Txe/YoeB family toxin of Txe-Axe toxin-antitoxin module